MRQQSWRANRIYMLLIALLLCVGLIFVSTTGSLSSLEDIVATPLRFISGVFVRASQALNNFSEDETDIQALQDRNAELEEALILAETELIRLREIASDYQRLSELLDYTTSTENQETITADVIGIDPNGAIRSILINRGSRDGIDIGMPVVTQAGLVGRIIRVSANASQVQLITDQNSAVSARLQTTRAQGSVIGLLTGNLRMTFIELDEEIVEGDVIITSGLGGNFPIDIVIGQVTSVQQFEFELFQEAEVRSRINFDTLETVLVVTSFQQIDLSVFEEPSEEGS